MVHSIQILILSIKIRFQVVTYFFLPLRTPFAFIPLPEWQFIICGTGNTTRMTASESCVPSNFVRVSISNPAGPISNTARTLLKPTVTLRKEHRYEPAHSSFHGSVRWVTATEQCVWQRPSASFGSPEICLTRERASSVPAWHYWCRWRVLLFMSQIHYRHD